MALLFEICVLWGWCWVDASNLCFWGRRYKEAKSLSTMFQSDIDKGKVMSDFFQQISLHQKKKILNFTDPWFWLHLTKKIPRKEIFFDLPRAGYVWLSRPSIPDDDSSLRRRLGLPVNSVTIIYVCLISQVEGAPRSLLSPSLDSFSLLRKITLHSS